MRRVSLPGSGSLRTCIHDLTNGQTVWVWGRIGAASGYAFGQPDLPGGQPPLAGRTSAAQSDTGRSAHACQVLDVSPGPLRGEGAGLLRGFPAVPAGGQTGSQWKTSWLRSSGK